ncbi:MAG: glycosyltransferase family 4 protein [Chloroflexi bacterium]|nr:glycosyltransferase family 4 protein [Chloroflexota bacterium]
MNILYHLTILPPKIPAAEALSQEIATVRQHFPGEIMYLNPNIASPVYLPRLLFGWHKLPQIRQREAQIDLHHVYNPDPFPFPILRFLQRPVVYSLSSGIGQKRPNLRFLSGLTAVTVPDQRSYDKLCGWGLQNVHLLKTGIENGRFSHTPRPLNNKIRLLIASAPWTKGQFSSKGVNALLALAQQRPNLELIFLWRGHLLDEMSQRVAAHNLGERVQVIDRLVDVNAMLATVHATVNLAADADIIKAYPHSLLDSLAAGKPLLVSQAIPMADYVAQTGCGVVVKSVSPAAIGRSLDELLANYERMVQTAVAGQHDFSQEAMIDSYRDVYTAVLANGGGK